MKKIITALILMVMIFTILPCITFSENSNTTENNVPTDRNTLQSYLNYYIEYPDGLTGKQVLYVYHIFESFKYMTDLKTISEMSHMDDMGIFMEAARLNEKTSEKLQDKYHDFLYGDCSEKEFVEMLMDHVDTYLRLTQGKE